MGFIKELHTEAMESAIARVRAVLGTDVDDGVVAGVLRDAADLLDVPSADAGIACRSVVGGWQTVVVATGELIGPVKNTTPELWAWQRDTLKRGRSGSHIPGATA